MNLSRLITGIFFLLFSAGLFVLAFFSGWIILIYSIPFFIVGIVILLNRNEDRIEERADMKHRKNLNKRKSDK